MRLWTWEKRGRAERVSMGHYRLLDVGGRLATEVRHG